MFGNINSPLPRCRSDPKGVAEHFAQKGRESGFYGRLAASEKWQEGCSLCMRLPTVSMTFGEANSMRTKKSAEAKSKAARQGTALRWRRRRRCSSAESGSSLTMRFMIFLRGVKVKCFLEITWRSVRGVGSRRCRWRIIPVVLFKTRSRP